MVPSLSSLLSAVTLVASAEVLTYDHVIIGAETSGLAMSSRVTELSNIAVAVIEAGESEVNNINVTSIADYGNAFGTQIDCACKSINQTYAAGTIQNLRAGKAIGGTSTINAYARAEDDQVDAWEAVENEGWNWTTLSLYYFKSEQFQAPEDFQIANGIIYNSAFHRTAGPLKTGFLSDMINGTIGTA